MYTRRLLTMAMVAGLLTACGSQPQQPAEPAAKRTAETEALLTNLGKTAQQGMMFGHHDDTVYGIGWEGDEDRSDVKSVCGDYPAVISFDLGEVELDSTRNLDKISFDTLRKEIAKHYARGGMISFSWHVRNPQTGGDAWDVSDSTVVASILPNGANHQKFAGWLDTLAGFLNSLKTEDGTKIPVLFRPWHEHTGSWFWWGAAYCTPDEYKQLWRMTVDSLQAKGVDNALYAYSTGTEPQDTTQYLERYPGDDLVDMIGFDAYQFEDRDAFVAGMEKELAIIDSIGRAHGKLTALTEVGFEGIPDSLWWTETLLPSLEKYPLSYVLAWRNAREKPGHFYAPYPGQVSEKNFVEFYRHPKTLFLKEVSLYK